MKKQILALAIAMLFILSACGQTNNKDTKSETTNETVEESSTENTDNNSNDKLNITTIDKNNETVNIEVPSNPKRVVVLDLAALDTIDAIQKGDSIVGLIKNSKLSGKESYYDSEEIENVGSAKEVDLEKIMSLKPDLIFAGSRLLEQYDELSKIAPVVIKSANPRDGKTPYELIKENNIEISKIWGLENDVKSKLDSFDARLESIKSKSEGKTALIALVTKGNINLLSNSARTSIIGLDAGFNNINPESSDTHGNTITFEGLLELNPDYLFVLDRDQIVSNASSTLAKDLLNNDIVNKTEAYKNDRIVYLKPDIWYLAEGGLNALETMISDIESSLK